MSHSLRFMLRHSSPLLLLPLLLVLPVFNLCLFVSSACSAESIAAPAVPDSLRAQPDETVVLRAHARGVQVYECRVMRDQPAAYGWAFTAPEADLFDDEGAKLGDHYAGPTWHATDGSRITGTVRGRAEAPQSAAGAGGAIPWLLLTAMPANGRPTNGQLAGDHGLFSRVTSVQRVNTTGGLAPRITCHEGNAGAVARVPYTADYYFLGTP